VDEDQHRTQTTPVEVVKSNAVGGHESALVGGSVRPPSTVRFPGRYSDGAKATLSRFRSPIV
jgi:hypothetical protein